MLANKQVNNLLKTNYSLQHGCQTRGPRDDSKIPNEFRQNCNVSSSKKRSNPLTQATLERYRLFLFGDQLHFVPQNSISEEG